MEAYRRALQIEIDDPRANYRLGVLLMRFEHYGDALTPLRMHGATTSITPMLQALWPTLWTNVVTIAPPR